MRYIGASAGIVSFRQFAIVIALLLGLIMTSVALGDDKVTVAIRCNGKPATNPCWDAYVGDKWVEDDQVQLLSEGELAFYQDKINLIRDEENGWYYQQDSVPDVDPKPVSIYESNTSPPNNSGGSSSGAGGGAGGGSTQSSGIVGHVDTIHEPEIEDCGFSSTREFSTWTCSEPIYAAEAFSKAVALGVGITGMWFWNPVTEAWELYAIVGDLLVPGSINYLIEQDSILYFPY